MGFHAWLRALLGNGVPKKINVNMISELMVWNFVGIVLKTTGLAQKMLQKRSVVFIQCRVMI